MRTWITMFRDCHPRSGGILTLKIDKIDGNVEHCHEGKKTGRFRAGCGQTGRPESRHKFFDSCRSGHGEPFRTHPGATLAGSDGIRLHCARGDRSRSFLSRVRKVSGGTDDFRASRAGGSVYGDVRVVRAELVLAGEEEEMR